MNDGTIAAAKNAGTQSYGILFVVTSRQSLPFQVAVFAVALGVAVFAVAAIFLLAK